MNKLLRGIIGVLFLTSLQAIPVSNEVKAQIVGNPSYTNVTINPTSGNYEITSNFQFNGGSAILNRFTQFNLPSGQVAQMYLGSTATTAVNVVANTSGVPTQINGTLNLRMGNLPVSPIGGKMIFVDPNGIFVGPAGSINAGGILLSTSNETWLELQSSGFININDPSEDSKLASEVINFNGMYGLYSISGNIDISGTLDSRGVGAANSPAGIFLNGAQVNINSTATLNTLRGSNVSLMSAYKANINPGSADAFGIVDSTDPLSSGGGINVNGKIDCPQNNVVMTVDTLDVVNNIVNIKGLINASALSTGNNPGGTVIIDVVQPGIVNGSGGVILDGTGSTTTDPRGHILANGYGSGDGGYMEIYTPQFRIINGGGISLKNGVNSEAGGYLYLENDGYNYSYIHPTDLDAFTTGETLSSIQTADASVYPDTIGTIEVVDNSLGYSGMYINDNMTLQPKTDVIFETEGDLYVETSSIKGNSYLGFFGNDLYVIDSSIDTTNNSICFLTDSGNIFIYSGSYINTDTGEIYMLRSNGDTEMIVASDGYLSAPSGDIYIGNELDVYNDYPITLLGTTFGSYEDSYYSSDIIYPDRSTPDLYTNSVYITNDGEYIFDPVYPDDPSWEEEKIIGGKKAQDLVATAIESTTNEAIELAMEEEVGDLAFSEASDVSGDYGMEGFANQSLFDSLKSCKGNACSTLLSSNSIGGKLVDKLFNGYTPEYEYVADNNGIKYTIQSNYSPKGLEHFLNSVKEIEKSYSEPGNSNVSSLLSYKHPPTDIRLSKIDHEIKQINEKNSQNLQSNENEFNSIINDIKD